MIGMILGIFDLQVTPMHSTKFQVNWPLGSGEETKNRFYSTEILIIFVLSQTFVFELK